MSKSERLLWLQVILEDTRQRELIERKLESGVTLAEALRTMAFPGHSEHHTGRAIDVGSTLCEHVTESFETTPEFAWMKQHAAAFGFSLSYPRDNRAGIAYEPWHWCFRT